MAYRCVIIPGKGGRQPDKRWYKGTSYIPESDIPANVKENQECKEQRYVQAGPGAKLPPKSKTPELDNRAARVYSCHIERGKKIYRENGKFIDEYDIPSGQRKRIACVDDDMVNKKKPKTAKKSAAKQAEVLKKTRKSPRKSAATTKKKSAPRKKSVQQRQRVQKRQEALNRLNEVSVEEKKPKSKTKAKSPPKPASPKPKSKSKKTSAQKPAPKDIYVFKMTRKSAAKPTRRQPSEDVDM